MILPSHIWINGVRCGEFVSVVNHKTSMESLVCGLIPTSAAADVIWCAAQSDEPAAFLTEVSGEFATTTLRFCAWVTECRIVAGCKHMDVTIKITGIVEMETDEAPETAQETGEQNDNP